MNILLANIGNRNIRHNGEFIEKSYDKQSNDSKNEDFYEYTKMLYENIETEKNNIKIEIIDSILNKNKIDKIYLFATNQKPNFIQDTYYEAKIIEYLLKDQYKIEIIELHQDPRNRENIFKFFENFFEENKDLNNHKLLISGSGGVPAMKEALNFYSIIKYTSNSTIVDVDEKTKDLFSSEIQNEYLKNFDKDILKEMIQNYDYSGAYIFLKKSRIKNIQLENYLLYTSNRFNFNFQELKEININIRGIPDSDEKLLIELIENIEISFLKGEYSMLLGKVFRFNEAINKYIYYLETGELLDSGVNIRENENGKNFLDENYEISKAKNKHKNYNNFVNNNDSLVSIERKIWLLNYYHDFEKLRDRRNKSIMAHGWEGISKKEVLPIINLIKQIKSDFFGINKNSNIYHEINKELLSLIK